MIEPSTVAERIGALLKVPRERVRHELALSDLVHESFLLIQLVMDLQDDFGFSLVQEDLREVSTVGDLVRLVVSRATHS